VYGVDPSLSNRKQPGRERANDLFAGVVFLDLLPDAARVREAIWFNKERPIMTAVRSVAAAAAELGNTFRGELLEPGDAGYDEARRVHHGFVDKYPALIAQCRNSADVAKAIKLTQQLGLEVAVRGGGHNVAGRATIDGGASRGFMLYARSECVGYAYVTDGHIGPLAVTRKTLVVAAFRTALNIAAEGPSADVSTFVPGTCYSALSAAIDHRMRVTIPMVLMSTNDYGNWAQYLLRNPGFM
jgi:FAD binding domain-containing protein